MLRKFISKGQMSANSLVRFKMIERLINNYPERIFKGLSSNMPIDKSNVA